MCYTTGADLKACLLIKDADAVPNIDKVRIDPKYSLMGASLD